MGNTPNIRFKGFTDDWEQRKLGDVFEQTANIVNPNEEKIELWSLTVEDGLTSKTERYNREFLVKKDNNFKEVRPGDIVYNPMNMTLGAVGYNGMSKSVAVSGYYTTMIANEGYDSYYINTWLKSPQAISLYKIFATGSLIEKQRVQFSTLSIIPATFPNYEEQQKIGQYFSNLDHIITLHQRKCDETKKLKKFMLQKMFPKKDEKKPEIRFAGFTDDWEQRKLGDVLVSLQNNTLSRADLSNESGVAKNVHYGDVLIKFGEVLDVGKEQLPMITDERVLSKYKASFLQNGDVIVADTAEDSTVGKCSEIAGLNGDIVLSGLHTIPYRPVEKFATGYLGYYLNSGAYHNQLIPLMQGIKVTSVSKSAMQDTDIVYPKSVKEQAMIGNCFQSLDHLITLHQRKCDEIKEIKKFMLKNMFPQKG
ncbi:restriction endonuclease subunit S [Lachnospira eligens]|uniref:restriction endonuclease subunit S n=1 Tax=Lachnospira eligens TaxID=39485 RepID=UPI000E5395F2|nr:restriction endonuclease subunit S [Lachnospira eligens]RHI65148.1 restriction endonuclease subunit S [Lachnospira eligens]